MANPRNAFNSRNPCPSCNGVPWKTKSRPKCKGFFHQDGWGYFCENTPSSDGRGFVTSWGLQLYYHLKEPMQRDKASKTAHRASNRKQFHNCVHCGEPHRRNSACDCRLSHSSKQLLGNTNTSSSTPTKVADSWDAERMESELNQALKDLGYPGF